MNTEKLKINSTPMSWVKEKPKPVVVYYCTIFKKSTNRALYSTRVPKWFSERYGAVLWIAKWINWDLDQKTYKALRQFLLKKNSLPKKYEHLIEKFNKKFRVLITSW